MTIIEKIKAEIERLIKLHDSLASYAESEMIANLEIGAAKALDDILPFLSTLESEKPLGLEEEINRLWESFADEMEGPHNLFDIYARLARHFAQWGAEHLADNKVVAVKLGDEIAINGYKLVYDKNENAIRVAKVEPNGSPEIQNDLKGGGTKAVRLPDGRYVTEKLARELEEESPSDQEYVRKDSLWKPTPEQLEAMECAIIDFEEDGCNTIAGYLKEIYNQIKKL